MFNTDNTNDQTLIATNAVLKSENERLKDERPMISQIATIENELKNLRKSFDDYKGENEKQNDKKLAKTAIWISIIIPIIGIIASVLIALFIK